MKFLRYNLVFIMLFILNCCAIFGTQQQNQQVSYVKPTNTQQNFNISGRMSIVTPAQSKSAHFDWVRNQESEELNLTTPLGQTVARLLMQGNNTTLYIKDKEYSNGDLTTLMQEQLGFSIPLNYLHYWIEGVSVPNVSIEQQFNDGFKQLDWEIHYLKWKDANHPEIVQCVAQDISIKILINWEED